MLVPGNFVHRCNSDGSYDSICTICLMTVASVESEWQLAGLESAHTCNPEMRCAMDQARARTHDAEVRILAVTSVFTIGSAC